MLLQTVAYFRAKEFLEKENDGLSYYSTSWYVFQTQRYLHGSVNKPLSGIDRFHTVVFFSFFRAKESLLRTACIPLSVNIYIQHGIKNFFGKLSFAILIISRSNKIFPSSSAQHWCNSYKRYTHTLIKVYPTFTQSRIDKRSLTSSILVDQSRLSRIGKYLHLTALLITFLYILHVKNIFDAIFTSVPLIHRAIK